MIAKTTDPLDTIERDLAAEDARLGEWPPPQWWAKAKTTGTYTTGDGVTHAIPPGTVVYATDLDTGKRVEHVTITNWPTPDPEPAPLLRDNYGDPVDPGRPLTRREGFWLAATIAAVIVGLLGLAWLAVWVLGGAG